MQYPHWEKELGIPIRWPRPPIAALKAILQSAEEPQILLRADDDGDAIVIKFAKRSNEEHIERLAESLPAAFEEILWGKAEKQSNTTWAEFQKISRAAYRDAWMMLFERRYRIHRDPRVERWLGKSKHDLESASKPNPRLGRPPSPKAEGKWLERQFNEIFPQCEGVHKAAQNAVSTPNKPTEKEIRKAVWAAVSKSIRTMPNYGAIFSGEAFDHIGSKRRDKPPQLHDPKSWNPRQLAISLLGMRLARQYQTVEKLLSRISPSRRK
jgi:hypothetical protein